MKTISIIIKGEMYYCDCYSMEFEDEDGEVIDSDYVESGVFIKPNTVEVNGIEYYPKDKDNEPTWGRKYNKYWSYAMRGDEFPFKIWIAEYRETLIYKLKLEDDEEFDIHKLAFIFSKEFKYLENAAIYQPIIYDGNFLELEGEEDDNHVGYGLSNAHAYCLVQKGFDDVIPEDAPDYVQLPYQQDCPVDKDNL